MNAGDQVGALAQVHLVLLAPFDPLVIRITRLHGCTLSMAFLTCFSWSCIASSPIAPLRVTAAGRWHPGPGPVFDRNVTTLSRHVTQCCTQLIQTLGPCHVVPNHASKGRSAKGICGSETFQNRGDDAAGNGDKGVAVEEAERREPMAAVTDHQRLFEAHFPSPRRFPQVPRAVMTIQGRLVEGTLGFAESGIEGRHILPRNLLQPFSRHACFHGQSVCANPRRPAAVLRLHDFSGSRAPSSSAWVRRQTDPEWPMHPPECLPSTMPWRTLASVSPACHSR